MRDLATMPGERLVAKGRKASGWDVLTGVAEGHERSP